MHCRSCGASVDEEARFCSACGTPTEVAQQSETEKAPTPSAVESMSEVASKGKRLLRKEKRAMRQREGLH